MPHTALLVLQIANIYIFFFTTVLEALYTYIHNSFHYQKLSLSKCSLTSPIYRGVSNSLSLPDIISRCGLSSCQSRVRKRHHGVDASQVGETGAPKRLQARMVRCRRWAQAERSAQVHHLREGRRGLPAAGDESRAIPAQRLLSLPPFGASVLEPDLLDRIDI